MRRARFLLGFKVFLGSIVVHDQGEGGKREWRASIDDIR